MKPSAIRIERMLAKVEATLVPPERKCLRAVVHEHDNEAEQAKKQQEALAEHVAAHPEDAGMAVEDFNWIEICNGPKVRWYDRPSELGAWSITGLPRSSP
jgi:hypothetical protein